MVVLQSVAHEKYKNILKVFCKHSAHILIIFITKNGICPYRVIQNVCASSTCLLFFYIHSVGNLETFTLETFLSLLLHKLLTSYIQQHEQWKRCRLTTATCLHLGQTLAPRHRSNIHPAETPRCLTAGRSQPVPAEKNLLRRRHCSRWQVYFCSHTDGADV